MGKALAWGRRYAMVRPDHFRVDYAINPYMDVRDQPDPGLVRRQWGTLLATLESLSATVEVLGQPSDAPDMVYAMNLGFAVNAAEGTTGPGSGGPARVVLSHMRHPERRVERAAAASWFSDLGYRPVEVGRDGVGGHLEAGDAFSWGDGLVAGFGPRTDELGLKALAGELGARVRGVRIVHPGMYHLDLAFCPLDSTRAMVCPEAFDAPGARALLDLVPEPLVLTAPEAQTFCANSVVVGRTVVMPACPDRVRAQLLAWGFEVVVVEMSELHKGGGSIRCLTSPLDLVLGRDLPVVPGGELHIAR
jgi:N-dimethylarginine dimethylaminohydrolase